MARENIDVTVELHDRLSRPADKAAESVEDLREEVDDLNVSLEENTKQTNQAGDAQGQFAKSTDAAAKSQANLNAETNRGKKATDALGDSIGGVTGRMKASSSGGKALGLVLKGLLVVGLVPFLYGAVGAITALGAAAYATVASLSPLVGLLGAMPALLTTLIQSIAGVKLGFKGIGDAMKVLSDPDSTIEEIRAALDTLTPAGREFVNVLGELKEQTAGWAKTVQSAMLPGFTAGLKSLGPILPIVERGLAETGLAIGEIARQAGEFAGRSGPALEQIMERNARMLRLGFGPALISTLAIFRDLTVAGGPMADRFSLWLADAADNLKRLVHEGRKSGSLEAFFDRAGDKLVAVKDVLGDLGAGLFNIGKLSMVLADSMGASFAGAMTDFRAWTESAGGRASIAEFFSDAIPVVEELGRLTVDVLKSLGGVLDNADLVPLLAQIRTELLPALGRLGGTLSTDVGPAVIDTLVGIADGLASLPITPLVALLEVIGLVVKAFGGLLGGNETLATLVAVLATMAIGMKIASASTTLFSKAMARTTGVVGLGVARLKGLGSAFDTTNRSAQRASMSVSAFAAAERKRKGAMAGGALATAGMAFAMSGYAEKMGLSNTTSLALAGSLAGPWGAAVGGGIGLAMDLSDAALDLSESFAAVDDALKSGSVELIDQQLQKMHDTVAQLDNLGHNGTMRDLLQGLMTDEDALLTDTKLKIVELEMAKNRLANGGSMNMGDLFPPELVGGQLSAQMGAAADSVEEFAASFTNLHSVLDRSGSLIAYEEALDTLVASIKENGQAWGYTGAAGRENLTNLNGLVDKTITRANKLKEANDAVGAQRFLTRSIKDLKAFAGDSEAAKDAIQPLIRVLRELDGSNAKPKVDPDTKPAETDLSHIDGYLTMLDNTTASPVIDPQTSTALAKIQGVREAVQNLAAVASFGLSVPLMNIPTPKKRKKRRASGGPLAAGDTALVGELGPELFLPRGGGLPQLIGAGGPEVRGFAQSGYVVPNPTTPASIAKPLPSWVEARLEPELAVAGAPASRAVAGGDGGAAGSPELHVHLHGDSSGLTMDDVRTGALQAYRQHEKEKKERR